MKQINYIAIMVVVLLSISSAAAQAPAGAKYIGYKYEVPKIGEKLSNGFTYNGGGLIGDVYAEKLYGVSILSKAKTKMFWLEISTARADQGGVTAWEVKDVLEFSDLRANDFILEFSDPGFECRRGKTAIAENLIGIGTFNRKRGIFTPRKLWRPNAETAKFEPFSVRNVRCIYSEP